MVKAMPYDQHDRILAALRDVYNACAADLGWADTPPSKAEFVDVLCDRVRLPDADAVAFSNLSARARRALCLEVGP